MSKEHMDSKGDIQHLFSLSQKRELLPLKTKILSWQNVKRQCFIKGHIKVKP